MNSLKHAALWLALALAATAASAQGPIPRKGTVAELGDCDLVSLGGSPRLRTVTDGADATDCTTGEGSPGHVHLCYCDGSSWAAVGSAGGSGDVTAIGDCTTGDCFQAVGQRFAFLGPVGGAGIAAFRAIVEADISDLAHTTDTTCLDAGVNCLFAGSATEGGAATTATALAANGGNCSAGQWAAGVDASGVAEGCTADADTAAGKTFTGLDTEIVTGTPGAAGNCATWNIDGDLVDAGAACGGGGGIGGSTGATDSAVLLADGTGGATVKSSGADLVFSDALNRLVLQGDSGNIPDFQIYRSSAGVGLKRWSIQNVGGSSSASISIGLLNDGATAWTKQNVFIIRVDANGSFADLGTASPPTRLRRGSQATAPATCVIGDDYVDDSGALCFCSVTNTWEQLNAVGSCV